MYLRGEEKREYDLKTEEGNQSYLTDWSGCWTLLWHENTQEAENLDYKMN